MSGSGKTTLGQRSIRLAKQIINAPCFWTAIMSGTCLETMLITIQGRYKNAERISHMCKFFDKENIDVIAAVLSIFPEWQAWNRENLNNYFEIFRRANE